jgi:hypothetical protein
MKTSRMATIDFMTAVYVTRVQRSERGASESLRQPSRKYRAART